MCGDQVSVDYVVGVHAGWAELALWEGRPREARAEVAAALELVGHREDPLYTPVLCSLGCRAEADVAALDRGAVPAARDRAAELAARLDGIVARHGLRVAPVEAEAHRALAAAERARLGARPDPAAWEAAEGRWRALEHPYPAAYAAWRRAEALVAAGDRGAAGAALARARDTARALGARPLLAAIDVLGAAARLPSPAASPGEEGAGRPLRRPHRPAASWASPRGSSRSSATSRRAPRTARWPSGS
jgi:hypothetical protein